MTKMVDIIKRLVANFFSVALSVVGGSAVISHYSSANISVVHSAILAGVVASFDIIEKLAKSSIDGTLTKKEINEAFLSKSTDSTAK